MHITFKTIALKNPRQSEAPAKYYADIIGNGKTTFDDLAKYASAMSTVSKADILAVMEITFSKIAEDVADGKIVYVGEYFTLQAGGSSEPRETAEQVDASCFKSIRTIFRPSRLIKNALKLSTLLKKN